MYNEKEADYLWVVQSKIEVQYNVVFDQKVHRWSVNISEWSEKPIAWLVNQVNPFPLPIDTLQHYSSRTTSS